MIKVKNLDCFVALLLAMTVIASEAKQSRINVNINYFANSVNRISRMIVTLI